MFSASGPPATCRGEARFARRPRPSAWGALASHAAMSKIGLENVVSVARKQRSTAAAGLPAITWAWVRTELIVSFGALAFRFDSQVSMVRNDFTVTAAICGGIEGKRPNGPEVVAPP